MAERVAEVDLECIVAGNRRVLLHSDAVIAGERLEEDVGPSLMDHVTLSVAVALGVAVTISACKLRNVDCAQAQVRLSEASVPGQVAAEHPHVADREYVAARELVLHSQAELLLTAPRLAVGPGRVSARGKPDRG